MRTELGWLVRNRAQCPECKQIIESHHVHDFVSCECGNIHVDGGLEYAKRGYCNTEPIELSEYDTGSVNPLHRPINSGALR